MTLQNQIKSNQIREDTSTKAGQHLGTLLYTRKHEFSTNNKNNVTSICNLYNELCKINSLQNKKKQLFGYWSCKDATATIQFNLDYKIFKGEFSLCTQ